MLDYGVVWTPPPPTPEEIAASNAAVALAKAQADATKKKADDAALKYDLDLAAKGDAYGQLRMGERYRDGDGVAKDLAKARQMFSLAADQGNSDAATDLAKLPAP
jgi:localization factor PodJL